LQCLLHDKLAFVLALTQEMDMGNGVFIAEGDRWRRQRKLVRPAFRAMRIRDYMKTMVERVELTVVDAEPAVLDTVITLRPRDPLRMFAVSGRA
jgi:cytochrome P450